MAQQCYCDVTDGVIVIIEVYRYRLVSIIRSNIPEVAAETLIGVVSRLSYILLLTSLTCDHVNYPWGVTCQLIPNFIFETIGGACYFFGDFYIWAEITFSAS